MRLFLAIRLTPELKGALIDVQSAWYDMGVRGRFTPEENLHLTLAFIGEYPDPEAVLDALKAVSFAPIPLTLNGIGAFGDLWWAGVSGGPALTGAARRVRRALAEAGILFDRKRFSPHITLLRRASVSSPPPVALAPVSMSADAITLFRSDRGKNGMLYTELGNIRATQSGDS